MARALPCALDGPCDGTIGECCRSRSDGSNRIRKPLLYPAELTDITCFLNKSKSFCSNFAPGSFQHEGTMMRTPVEFFLGFRRTHGGDCFFNDLPDVLGKFSQALTRQLCPILQYASDCSRPPYLCARTRNIFIGGQPSACARVAHQRNFTVLVDPVAHLAPNCIQNPQFVFGGNSGFVGFPTDRSSPVRSKSPT